MISLSRKAGLCVLISLGLFHTLSAQQNLFNVPSSDITIEGKPFFQQQFNIDQGTLLLNTTFCYGLGRNAEIGFNILGVNMNTAGGSPLFVTNSDPSNPPMYPFYTLNFQKAFPLNKTFKLSGGGQVGYSQGFHSGAYLYTNLVTVVTQTKSKIIGGVYYGSESFLGPGDRTPLLASDSDPVGLQLGLEQEVIKEKLLFIVEHISGKHSLGVTCVGGAWFFTEHWALSLGYQLANAQATHSNSLVIEFTYVPSSIVSRHIFRRGHHAKIYE